jgi:hypothetical protein
MPERSKRHHYVPQLHLRAFGTGGKRIATVDRRADRTWVQSIETAAAENHYNTVFGDDGQPSDDAERIISSLESDWTPALDNARSGRLHDHPATKVHLAFFIAFQYLRVPRQRDFAAELADQVTKLDIAAGGPGRIRERMEAESLAPTDAEVLAEWDLVKDFDSYRISRSTEGHLASQFGSIHKLAAIMLAGYQWTVLRWERCHLLTSDDPVVLKRARDHPGWSGVGFATAAGIQLAISRDTALVLANRSELAEHGHPDPPDIAMGRGTLNAARDLNWSTAAKARQYVYLHPDDDIDELVGPHRLPPPREQVIASNNAEMRRKLVATSEWAYANPDKPHPMSSPGELPRPNPGARTYVVDGRTRRIRAMEENLDHQDPPSR